MAKNTTFAIVDNGRFIHQVLTSEELLMIQSKPVLVALSGGADSVALLRLLLEAGCKCHAVHCNFHLRGEESMRDEVFVRQLCQQLGVPLQVKDFDVAAYQRLNGGSVEMACRELRYQWFDQERQRQGCAVIAVAHHADDQVETFFLNLLRGTGIKGLTGMERLKGNIWRPLLSVTRKELINYLNKLGQDHVTDSTNAANDYRRNRLRNIVLPILEQQFPNSCDRILDTMANLSLDQALLSAMVNQALPDSQHIVIDKLQDNPYATALLFHRIRHHGFNRAQCEQIIDAVVHGHTGRRFHGHGNLLVVNRKSIDIEPIAHQEESEIELDLNTGIQNPVSVTICRGDAPFSPLMCDGKRKVAFSKRIFDSKRIVLRHWRRGDRIRPFGMRGSKLISDLFTDLKLDHAAKQNVWLMEADDEILWVLGYRASALYPVPRESQDYLILTFN